MKKRFLSFALALCFAIPCMFFLASCGGSRSNPNCYMTFEDVGETHVYFDYNTNVARRGEDFTFGVCVGEGYDATKIVVSIDEEIVPLSEGQWKIQDPQTYSWVDMTTTPNYPFGRKWIYTIENVQKDMTISVDATQVEVGKIEASVSSAGSQSKFYVLKQDRNTIANTEEKIYSASFLGDQDIFEELEITDGKISFDYGKDLFIKIPEDLVEAFSLTMGNLIINDILLQESDSIVYTRAEEDGKDYVFAQIDSYSFREAQQINSSEISQEVENRNLIPIVVESDENFSLDVYTLSTAEAQNAVEIDGEYFATPSSPAYFDLNGEGKHAVYAYVGSAENIEDDPYYEPFKNYDAATKKIAVEIHKNNGTVYDELIENLEFSLMPGANSDFISVKEVVTEYGWKRYFAVIELPEGYNLSEYLNFVVRVKDSYLSQNYLPLNLNIQGAYGSKPFRVFSIGAENFVQDGKYYFKKEDIITKYFSQPGIKFKEFAHTTASEVELSAEDVSEYLLQCLSVGLEDVSKDSDSYLAYSKFTYNCGDVDVDEIWAEYEEDSMTDDTCCSTSLITYEEQGIHLVAGYKYNVQNGTYDTKFIWLSKQSAELEDPEDPESQEILTYQNYYYDFSTKTWHQKVGEDWMKIVEDLGLEVCEKPAQLGDFPKISGSLQSIDEIDDEALLESVRLFDETAEADSYKYFNVLDNELTWQYFVKTEDIDEENETDSPITFIIVNVGGTNYYYDYSDSEWKKEKVLGDDEILEDSELVELRENAYESFAQNQKKYLLGKYLKNRSTEDLVEVELSANLLDILKGAIPSASAEGYKAYQMSVDDTRFSNVTLIAQTLENDAEKPLMLVFDFDAYDGEELDQTDILHMVFDIKDGFVFNMCEYSQINHVFVGMDGLFESGLYYDEEDQKLFRLNRNDAYGFNKTNIFEAINLGNGFIEISTYGYSLEGSLVDIIENENHDKIGYVYMFKSNNAELYFKTNTPIVATNYAGAHKIEMAYHYYDFETKELSYPLFVFDMRSKLITQTKGKVEFGFPFAFDMNEAVIEINGVERESQDDFEAPEFVSNLSEYEIAGEAQEDFKFIEKAKFIYGFYAKTREDAEDANYVIDEIDTTFNNEFETDIADHLKLMYLKPKDAGAYVTIFESEHNGYLVYDQTDTKWYSVEFQKGIPSSWRLLTEAEIPEYTMSEVQASTHFLGLEEEEILQFPSISDQPYPGQIMKLLAAQLGIEATDVKYYPEANILEYSSYNYEKLENVRSILVYLTEEKVYVARLQGDSNWYKVLRDNYGIPCLLQKIEDKSRELADFGVFDIENDEITLSYTGIRSLKSLPHKLIFDSLLESGEIYKVVDSSKPFEELILADETLFDHYEIGENYYSQINFADEVYDESGIIFYSEARDIRIEKQTNVYDDITGDIIGQEPSEVYEAKVAHVKDIFGYDIAVEKDGKIFYLYILNQYAPSFDDKDWTLKARQEGQQML